MDQAGLACLHRNRRSATARARRKPDDADIPDVRTSSAGGGARYRDRRVTITLRADGPLPITWTSAEFTCHTVSPLE